MPLRRRALTKETDMDALRDKMQQDLNFAGFADETKRVYLSAAAALAKFHRRSPTDAPSQST